MVFEAQESNSFESPHVPSRPRQRGVGGATLIVGRARKTNCRNQAITPTTRQGDLGRQ